MSSYLRDTTLPHRRTDTRTKENQNQTNQETLIVKSSASCNPTAESSPPNTPRANRSAPSSPAPPEESSAPRHAAKLAGIEKCISFDMGGTSTDVALLTKELHTTSEAMVAGFPVAVPMLEIHTVGAGGGSIARFDAGGALRVGPQSAGSVPGPICYGCGTKPTVTDAHAVLGHLGTGGLLGGTFPLDIARAREYMQREINNQNTNVRRQLAQRGNFAEGIIAVANAVMEKAIRVISIERGHDPRDYTLVAFGGAGGLHACDLAAALGNAQCSGAGISRRIIRARNSPRRRSERIISNGAARRRRNNPLGK